jgi:uncharacterized Zn-binding protein involved in type VI secretion
MRKRLSVIAALSCCLCGTGAVAQQRQTDQPSATPGIITGGSGNVSVGGMPAARSGDATDQGQTLIGGSPNVFINGRPAATLGDRTGCGGVAVGGASNVFINGKPVARSGDMTTGCPEK